MIIVEHLNKSYGNLQVLRDINLTIAKAEVVSIVGASGAGKTTLLQLLGTLDRPDSGIIRYDQTDVTQLNEKALAAFRNQNIGFVFQFHNLLPEFTAIENVCMPALIAGRKMEEAKEEAYTLLRFLNVESRAEHKPAQLSGGEQQRIAIARELFFRLRDQYQQTFVIVTHNNTLAQKSDRQIRLRDGGIVNSED